MDDDELLEMELNYRPPHRDTRFFKTHPPGYNVISGLSATFGLGGFVLGALPTHLALGPNGMVITLIAGVVMALLLGFSVPRTLWVSIGPLGRGLLRPLGCLGSWAIWMMSLVAFAMIVNFVKFMGSGQSATDFLQGGPVKGPDWVVLSQPGKPDASRLLSLSEARSACSALGPEWRLANSTDLDFIRVNVLHREWKRCFFHLDEGDGLSFLWFQKHTGWSVGHSSASQPRSVLCIKAPKPPPPTPSKPAPPPPTEFSGWVGVAPWSDKECSIHVDRNQFPWAPLGWKPVKYRGKLYEIHFIDGYLAEMRLKGQKKNVMQQVLAQLRPDPKFIVYQVQFVGKPLELKVKPY